MTQADVPTCRSCGCTDESPCEGGCSWVLEDLCSTCAQAAGIVPPQAFAVGFLSCRCGQRCQPVAHQDLARLREQATPAVVAPSGPTEQQLAASEVVGRLQVGAQNYGDLLGRPLEPASLEAWACPACGLVVHLEAFAPPPGDTHEHQVPPEAE